MARFVTAGDLRERIVIERRTVVRNSYGEEVETWAPLATVWAKAEPLAGRERLMAQQVGATADVRFTVRYRADLTAADRIQWRGKPHDITAPPADVDARRQWLEIMAVQGVRDGR